jgi:hypothetical protein
VADARPERDVADKPRWDPKIDSEGRRIDAREQLRTAQLPPPPP